MGTHDSLPDDVETLKRLLLARDAELAQAHAEVANACQIALNSDPPFASKNDPL
jgi:hypothetical protein